MLTLKQTHNKIIITVVVLLTLCVSIFSIPTTVSAATAYPDYTSQLALYPNSTGKYIIYKGTDNNYYLDIVKISDPGVMVFSGTTLGSALLPSGGGTIYARYKYIPGTNTDWVRAYDYTTSGANISSQYATTIATITSVEKSSYTVYTSSAKTTVAYDPNYVAPVTPPPTITNYPHTTAGLYYIQYTSGTENFAVEFDLNLSNYSKIILATQPGDGGKINIMNYSQTSSPNGTWSTFGDVIVKKVSKWNGSTWAVTTDYGSSGSASSGAAMAVDTVVKSNIDIYNSDKTTLYYSKLGGSKFKSYPYWANVEVRFPTQNILGNLGNFWYVNVLGKQSSTTIYYKYYFTDIPTYKEMTLNEDKTKKLGNLSFIVTKGSFNTIMTGCNASKTAELGVTQAPAMIPANDLVANHDVWIYVLSSNFPLTQTNGTVYTPPHQADADAYLADKGVVLDESAPVTKQDFADNMDKYVAEGLGDGNQDSLLSKWTKLGSDFLDGINNIFSQLFSGLGMVKDNAGTALNIYKEVFAVFPPGIWAVITLGILIAIILRVLGR